MIGAIGLKLNENVMARLYLVGTYNNINWDNENPSELGKDFVSYCFKEDAILQPSVIISKGLDGEYILRLIETKRYILKIDNYENSVQCLPKFQNENNKNLRIEKDRDSVTFQFINYLGRSRVYFDGYEKLLMFEVIPDKMNYEEDYISLTEALADVCSELLLDYAGATSNVYSQSETDRKTLLEQFIFLRKFCYGDNLQGIFEAIKRNPDRVLDQEEELKPLGTGIPSKRFYRNPFTYSRGWTSIHADCDFGIYMPQMVSVTQKYDRLDTPANRFVKFAFRKFDYICMELIDNLQSDTNGMQIECLEEAKAIHSQLETIFRDSFFNDIGDLDIMPQNNQILQKREGYSQIFAAYSMLDLALQLDWRGKNSIYEGESKNVALLYEYWLFFELYKIIKSIEGCVTVKTDENPFLMIEDGITISLEEGSQSCQSFLNTKYGVKVNLYYNRTFSKTDFCTSKYEGSYSRPFRPDYSLAIFPMLYNKGKHNGEEEAMENSSVRLIHFDAKYRITDLTSLIGDKSFVSYDAELSEEKIDSVMNTYKRGDLLKMHTYNDAIRRTIGSFVLYPGSFDSNNTGNKLFSLFDEILPGVGAFAIKPSIEELGKNELKSFITTVFESIGLKSSRLNRLKYYTDMILSEPSVINSHSGELKEKIMNKNDSYVIGYIRDEDEADYYSALKRNGLFRKGSEILFYFYAIKNQDVYNHHKDVFRTSFFRFYRNRIEETDSYILEPFLFRIISNELISKAELVEKLRKQGYLTSEEKHHADFYYVLTVRVENDLGHVDEIKLSDVNRQSGNDIVSLYSPKVVSNSKFVKELI